ncbi:MAG: hypothetical protein M3N43_00605 [Actinomycetota bacterium]|nr:hypothetical protein [Actinomycetota bacterium]
MLDESVLEIPRDKAQECYEPWREESRTWRDLVAIGEAADRSGVTDGGRT